MVPVACGLLSKDFVKDLKDDGTYSPLTFAREYESKWGGGNVDSFFSGIEFDKNRVIQKPLWEALYRPEKGTKIILSYDVGRLDDNSSLLVIQLTPSPIKGNGTYTKKIVNIYVDVYNSIRYFKHSLCTIKKRKRMEKYQIKLQENCKKS